MQPGTWIPVEQRDTRWWIWVKKWMCRVSNIQSMSITYLRFHGMPTSGDAREDQAAAHEQIIRMLTIDEMVEFFRAGITVGVVRHEDTKAIYEHIVNHLNYWKHRLDTEFHIGDPPLDDLVLMDTFASAVYKHARHHFTQGMIESYLARHMSTILEVDRESILKPYKVKTVTINAAPEPVEEPSFPEHPSMAEAFNAHQAPGAPSSTGAPKPFSWDL